MMAWDPVCKQIIDKKEAKFSVVFSGEKYYFCSAHCKDEFVKNPEKYISLKPVRPEDSSC